MCSRSSSITGGLLRHEQYAAPVRSPFAYVRLHEPGRHLYDGSYSDTDLIWWTERIREWAAEGADILADFNDDGDANAVRNARTLRGMLGS